MIRTRRMRARLLALAMAALVLVAARPCPAQMTGRDVQVAVRTLGFIASPPSGAVGLAIVFDPAAPASVAESLVAQTVLGTGLRVGPATVSAVRVPVDDLARLSGLRFALLTNGLRPHFDRIFEATRRHGILSISPDFTCVRAGRCVMAVASEPRVQILVNREAARASAVEFDAAFRMMINEM